MTRPRSNKTLFHIGPYDLAEKVGSGGMGSVYRARDTRDGRVVALKLMHEHVASDPSYAERFRREAAVAALIDSPNVVRVQEFASDGGRPYIVTEFIDGPSVEQLLKSGPMEPAQATAIAGGVANGLAEAARRGVVHRDIKPANILIGPDGAPKVTDFGIATLNHSSSLTMPGVFVGTAAYAAPEQHRGEADVRSDMYSLGVVLFEMLTGSLPFEAETATGMMRKHEDAPVPLERLSGQRPALTAAVARALEKSPARRFQSPGEFAAALGAGSAAPVAAVAATAIVGVAGMETAIASGHEPFEPGATRIGDELHQTGEQRVLIAPPLAAFKAKLRELPLVRKTAAAAIVVACVTAMAMVGFRGSSADGGTQYSSGGGGGGPIDIPIETATPAPSATVEPSVTPSATVTRAPKTPPTNTPAPLKPTVAPAPAAPTTVPAPPPPAPAPALYITDYVFCHLSGCPYGEDDLYAGYPIGVAFSLSSWTAEAVAVEVWFDGEYQYTSNYTASSNGMYFDLLPYANYSGELELDVYVGGHYLGSMSTWVY